MKIFILLCFSLCVQANTKSFMPNSFSANFEESFQSMATGKEKKSYGKIDYKYPGNIRFEKKDPDPSTFVSNPQKSWYYVPPFVAGEDGQVTIQKSSKLPLTKFLDSIKNGIEGSKMFTAEYKGKELVLTFKKEMQKEMALKQVVLQGSKDAKEVKGLDEFEKLTLVYADGRKVNLKFIELKQDAEFAAGHFNFVVPGKTKVTTN
ncbi:MAG TPA: outer membrane lipoprotein carrier protein LolA [Bacteriovoracaceae bacterium]|nr:outer membrane lipoprotein carrier protein LolA [Bacteriovoracaceae bacterium]